jgi:hypothetical protein
MKDLIRTRMGIDCDVGYEADAWRKSTTRLDRDPMVYRAWKLGRRDAKDRLRRGPVQQVQHQAHILGCGHVTTR